MFFVVCVLTVAPVQRPAEVDLLLGTPAKAERVLVRLPLVSYTRLAQPDCSLFSVEHTGLEAQVHF